MTEFKPTSFKAHFPQPCSLAEYLTATDGCNSNTKRQMVYMYCWKLLFHSLGGYVQEEGICMYTCKRQHPRLSRCMCIQVCECDERAKHSPTVYLMTLIPLRQPIRALGVSRRPALATRYLPNMCRGLLPSPINSPSMERRRDGEIQAWKGIRGKNNSPNYNSQGVGGNNGA